MPAQKITPGSVQLSDPPAAGDPVYDAGTDEIGPRSSKPAGDADDTDGLCHVLPIATTDAYAISEMYPFVLGPQIYPGHLLPPMCPLARAYPSSAQAASTTQPIHVDRSVGFHRVAPRSAASPRSEPAHGRTKRET
jgi:hypothetical protein